MSTESPQSPSFIRNWLQPFEHWRARAAFARRFPRPLTAPLLAHIHVPKCGGTSFRHFLTSYYGSSHLPLYVADTFYIYSEDEVAAAVKPPSVTGFSSHFVRTFPSKLAGRDVLYLTFLRDPIDQFVSYITYVKKNFHTINDEPLLTCLPPDPPSLSVREIAHWILTSDRDINFRENYTVNFFARFPARAKFGPDQPAAEYRRHRLKVAQQVLEQFFFVGVSEQMERSVAVLRGLSHQIGLSLPDGEVPLENTSFEFRDDLSWIRPDDPVGRLLLNSIAEDRKLYNFALSRLQTLEAIAARPY